MAALEVPVEAEVGRRVAEMAVWVEAWTEVEQSARGKPAL